MSFRIIVVWRDDYTLIPTLKPQSNGPLYSNTVIGRPHTLAVDEPGQATRRCTKCNSPPVNGQCTNFMIFDVAI